MKQSRITKLFRMTSFIIWDEVAMTKCHFVHLIGPYSILWIVFNCAAVGNRNLASHLLGNNLCRISFGVLDPINVFL